MVSRLSFIVPLVALVAVAGLISQPAPAVAQVPDATQTPWVVIITVTQEAPTVTPAPAVIVLVTPTPNRVPPSLAIPDLPSYLGGGGESVGLMAANDSPFPPVVDQTITQFMDWLIARQESYRQMTGRYAQMLPSHSAPPADGWGQYPDGWYNHPTDQEFSWDSLNAIRYEEIPFNITIDTYQTPEGLGFVARFEIAVGGVTWRRAVNYGPAASRSHGWQIVTQEAQP